MAFPKEFFLPLDTRLWSYEFVMLDCWIWLNKQRRFQTPKHSQPHSSIYYSLELFGFEQSPIQDKSKMFTFQQQETILIIDHILFHCFFFFFAKAIKINYKIEMNKTNDFFVDFFQNSIFFNFIQFALWFFFDCFFWCFHFYCYWWMMIVFWVFFSFFYNQNYDFFSFIKKHIKKSIVI